MTPEEKDSVNKLAASLKKQGIASSMSDALRQAKQMLGIDEVMPQKSGAQKIIDTSENIPQEELKKKDEQKELQEDIDVTRSEKTVKQLIEEEKKETEEVEQIAEETKEIEKEEEKVEKEEEKDEKEIEKVEENIEKEEKQDEEIKEDIKEEEKREETEAKAEAKSETKNLTEKEKEDTDLSKIFNVNK